jgi:hypothetical protein
MREAACGAFGGRREDCPRPAVFLLLPVLVFVVVIGVFYVLISRPSTPGNGVALLLALLAAMSLIDGCLLLGREYSLSQDGRVARGIIVKKLSSTGASGSQPIGLSWGWRRGRSPALVTSTGFQFHDELARLMLTGSADAWVVVYRYPCDAARNCWEREFVRRELWSDLQVGQTVTVRTARGQAQGRLDQNPTWSTAIAKIAIGTTMALVAGLMSGRLALRRRRRYITAPAIVTAVDPVMHRGEVRWCVRFAYVDTDGTACESADEIGVSGLKPGDDCIAVYPPEHPDLGGLRLIPRG